jgi:hypothetical protein
VGPLIAVSSARLALDLTPPEDRGSCIARVFRRCAQNALSFFASLALHTIAFLILAYVVLGEKSESRHEIVIAPLSESTEPVLSDSPAAIPDISVMAEQPIAAESRNSEVRLPDAPNIASPFRSPTATAIQTRPADLARNAPINELLMATNAPIGGGFEGRTSDQRARLVAQRGGSPESETAVQLALAWLAAHQREDGGWRLNHQTGPCDSRCGNPGTTGTSTGATALALLPFLGAGYTHQQGKYSDVVEQGLYYLSGRMLETRHGGDLQEGTMYAQGLAAIALCEAYAMTGDQELRPYAQKAINFIVHAQHPRGGWRYVPGAPGDTTVTGWQVMALKSARLAKLYVPSHTTEMAKEFLNSVQEYDGAFYGYQASDKQPGPTAVGLLLRMYLGWHQDRVELARGTLYIGATGPSKTDMYFNYYATQVLQHYQGENWERWNVRMRDYLVKTQASSGHERGSWFFPDRHGSIGGRLYTTAICAMILEVYYRHMPLYGEEAVVDEF